VDSLLVQEAVAMGLAARRPAAIPGEREKSMASAGSRFAGSSQCQISHTGDGFGPRCGPSAPGEVGNAAPDPRFDARRTKVSAGLKSPHKGRAMAVQLPGRSHSAAILPTRESKITRRVLTLPAGTDGADSHPPRSEPAANAPAFLMRT
jgi:hypothetical protein